MKKLMKNRCTYCRVLNYTTCPVQERAVAQGMVGMSTCEVEDMVERLYESLVVSAAGVAHHPKWVRARMRKEEKSAEKAEKNGADLTRGKR